MVLTLFICLAACLVAALMALPSLRARPGWRAMVTPLASIIGSGFLVLGPILNDSFGAWSPAVMAALCAVAWGFGGAIRYNIAALEAEASGAMPRAGVLWGERLASVALGLAYVISVAYYLNLFGSFAVSLTPWQGDVAARIVTSVIFVVIAGLGLSGGFSALERLEYLTVSLKLAIIAGLLVGLGMQFHAQWRAEALIFGAARLSGWDALRLAFGLIVTVQGFETARYMGADYPAPVRIRAMKLAQGLSAAIYMIYILLLTYLFEPDPADLSETAIIGMMAVVAPILPLMLVAAALAAQASAAVADMGGAGGLAQEVSGGRLKAHLAYVGLTAVGLVLTWGSDIFAIIAYASRAFAFYYALQSGLAALRARGAGQGLRACAYWALAALGVAITVLGLPAEG